MNTTAQPLDDNRYNWKLPSTNNDSLDLTLQWGQISGHGSRVLNNVTGTNRSVTTTHTLLQDIDVRCYDGKSHYIHLRDESVLVRSGHEVALVIGTSRYTGESGAVAIYNTATRSWSTLEGPLTEVHGDLSWIRYALSAIIAAWVGLVMGRGAHDFATGAIGFVIVFSIVAALGWLVIQFPSEVVQSASLSARLQPVMSAIARGEFRCRVQNTTDAVSPAAAAQPQVTDCYLPGDARLVIDTKTGRTEYEYSDGRRVPGRSE